jgi:glycosyltransferase involved in cell wall biosynthesis
MRIIFINFTKFWGGGEQWTFEVMSELRKRNYSVQLLANTKSKLLQKAMLHDFETVAFDINKFSFLNLVLLSKLRTAFIKIKPEVIILNSTLELKTVGFIIKACGCSNVIFNRGIPRSMKAGPIKRYLFSNVITTVLVNSNYVKNSVSNLTKYLINEPEIVYHGILPDSKIQSEGNTKNIAIVGRLSNEKGIDLALQMMQKVLNSEPDAKLWIIGDGKDKAKLLKYCSKLGIENSVVFWGFVSDVEELLVKCSILIMTSRWEGFGLVLLEAMKLKIPCISFDHLAANEIIINNETGFLIPNMNIELMAEKIIYLLSNPDIGRRMGEKGNSLLKEKFTLKKSIDGYEKLFRRS